MFNFTFLTPTLSFEFRAKNFVISQFFKIILILEQSQKKAFRKDDILSSETTYDPISKQFKAKQHYTLGQNEIFCPENSLHFNVKIDENL